MMTTSDELRAWRSARRWTQQQAADELDYSLRAYAEYEKPDKAVPKWLALAITAMPPDKPVRSAHGTTLGDLSDEDNIRQADHELKRATNDAQLADWARRWGECAVERMHAVVTMEEEVRADAQDDIEAAEATSRELEREKGDLEDKYFALRKAADAVFSALPMQPTDAELSALQELL